MANRLQQFWDNVVANLRLRPLSFLLGGGGWKYHSGLFRRHSAADLRDGEQAGIVSLFSVVLIGLVGVRILNINRGGSKPASNIALALISEECEYLVRTYRRLDATIQQHQASAESGSCQSSTRLPPWTHTGHPVLPVAQDSRLS